MSEEEGEIFDQVGFRHALNKLATREELEIIKDLAIAILGKEALMSLTYSTVGGMEHFLYFSVHVSEDVLLDSDNNVHALSKALRRELSYSDVRIVSKEAFDEYFRVGKYASCELVDPENLEKVKKFLNDYSYYMGFHSQERPRSESPVSFWQKERTEKHLSNLSSNDASPTKRSKHGSEGKAQALSNSSSGETSPRKNN